MCEAVGLEVARLKRTQIGNVKMGMLKQGAWRDLNETEVKKLLGNPFLNGKVCNIKCFLIRIIVH